MIEHAREVFHLYTTIVPCILHPCADNLFSMLSFQLAVTFSTCPIGDITTISIVRERVSINGAVWEIMSIQNTG